VQVEMVIPAAPPATRPAVEGDSDAK
jgi:hypothetical protein